jgi:DNA-binding response OmpR family regulator
MAYEGTTILLAEDDIILSELYTERLKQEGFTVVHAGNGEEALEFVKEYNPSLIILDIMMPKMNGLDVLKSLKENPNTAKIPVIIVTALVQEIEKLNKIMTQADAYVVKSEVLPGEIIEEVKKRLNNASGNMESDNTPSPLGVYEGGANQKPLDIPSEEEPPAQPPLAA